MTVFSHGRWGVGECSPLPRLSCDALPGYERILAATCRRTEKAGCIDVEALRPYPSILFGLETAFRHLDTGSFRLWDTPFSRGEAGIPINRLVWMAGYEDMLRQVEDKLREGFRCIKLKIGAIDFEDELSLLRHIRRRFSPGEAELRLDANGAFEPAQAMEKLFRLSEFGIHSIEQPIRAGQWDEMARLADQSPIPVALDEELIGCNRREDKQRLLEAVRPQYIILKPSLHGGISGCLEWIEEARLRRTGWWITSALESNVGLNAIAQWCATLGNPLPQGLGTGGLFTNNPPLPLHPDPPGLWWKESQPPLWENGWAGQVTTSGATARPRTIRLRQDKVVQSALATCRVLGLKAGDRALLCMPLQYIGAIMMVARTIVAGLRLTVCRPSGHPLKETSGRFRFAAMLPLQVYNSLATPTERKRLGQIDILLIGGGGIDPDLERELQGFPGAIYSTYAMTETLSHVGLRRINGPEATQYYCPLPGVSLTLAEDGALVVNAPFATESPLRTNDMAELLPDGRFRILGRKDNVINSGGIKIQAETLEEKLRPFMPAATFAITSQPDPRLGEAVVLLVQQAGHTTQQVEEAIAAARLSPYERPRHVRQVTAIPLAGNGKINRAACKALCLTTP